jgi:hypothetical protein
VQVNEALLRRALSESDATPTTAGARRSSIHVAIPEKRGRMLTRHGARENHLKALSVYKRENIFPESAFNRRD